MKQSQHQSTASSPCVRNCCLNEKDVCLGCFRHLEEIRAWNKLDDRQVQEVLQQANVRREAYLSER